MGRIRISKKQIREYAKKAHASRLAESASDHETAGDLKSPTSTQTGITRRRLVQIIREERGAYSMSQYVDSESDVDTRTRRPELQAILDAANAAHGVVPYRVLKDFFWSLNSTYASKRKILEGLDEAMLDEPIRMVPGDSFDAEKMKPRRAKREAGPEFKDTIVMSPAGDALLVGGQEVSPDDVDGTLEAMAGQTMGYGDVARLETLLKDQMADGYVEIPISWSPNTGWKF